MELIIQKHLRQPEWSAAVQAVSCFAVDVIHKYACIALLIGIQTLAFGNHITDIFMVLFYAAFLPGGVWIAVKYFGTDFTIFIAFQPLWKLKFHTIISQYYGEQLLEHFDAKLLC